jgi:hypothetical protein
MLVGSHHQAARGPRDDMNVLALPERAKLPDYMEVIPHCKGQMPFSDSARASCSALIPTYPRMTPPATSVSFVRIPWGFVADWKIFTSAS